MRVDDVEFIRSAADARGFPRDPAPQLALVGRSNVGKSSLINALTRRRVARTSAAPGKTRLLNLYRVRLPGRGLSELYLVDLPGYGYARGGRRSAAEFDELVTVYFEHAPASGGHPAARPHGPTAALLLCDARHPGLEVDLAAFDWLQTTGRPLVVAASKIDKLTRAERQRAERTWQTALKVPVLPYSAVTGEGLDELWTTISRSLNTPHP